MTPETVLDFWFVATEREAWFTKDGRLRRSLARTLRGRDGGGRSRRFRRLGRDGKTDRWRSCSCSTSSSATSGAARPPRSRGDPKARHIARRAVANGLDKQVPIERRVFFYMPFEHSEAPADQEWSVALIATLNDAQYLDYAKRHQDVVDRFGRFPHRNAALGRASTPEEEAYLAEPGAGF